LWTALVIENGKAQQHAAERALPQTVVEQRQDMVQPASP
jgi:hypothetical protein